MLNKYNLFNDNCIEMISIIVTDIINYIEKLFNLNINHQYCKMFLTNCFMTDLNTVMHFYAFKTFLSSIKELVNHAIILNIIL